MVCGIEYPVDRLVSNNLISSRTRLTRRGSPHLLIRLRGPALVSNPLFAPRRQLTTTIRTPAAPEYSSAAPTSLCSSPSQPRPRPRPRIPGPIVPSSGYTHAATYATRGTRVPGRARAPAPRHTARTSARSASRRARRTRSSDCPPP